MRRFLALFFVSATALAMETALTRYFAVASWSDYGYWVISIVMMGFAFSGVFLVLARGFLLARAEALFTFLPAALIVAGALGYAGCVVNPFNPLALQNQVTYLAQLENIALYDAALLPFFFLAGLFISLCFVAAEGRAGLVYAADLAGAGCGCVAVLGLMFVVPPFLLVAALLPGLAVAGFAGPRWRIGGPAACAALILGEALLALGPRAAVSQYKPVYPPLHTPGAKVVAQVVSPRGDYLLLDDFTERVNTDISNDAAMLGYADPPRSFGLYRDGTRLASLPEPGVVATGYAKGALDALPYTLLAGPDVLLAGASGGFRIAEVFALGAAHVTALEPEPVLFAALRHGLGAAPAFGGPGPALRILPESPRAALAAGHSYDLIDISADFYDGSPANAAAFTAQEFAADLTALRPGGMLSVPVSIEEFPAYALRMLATVRAALAIDGIAVPDSHVIVYRSAWNARILVSLSGFSAAQVAVARAWCDDRSFDVSWFAGINPPALRDDLYNDLPAVSFDAGTVTAMGPDDSIADEAGAVLRGQASVSGAAFDLRPMTDDRPGLYSVLRLGNLPLLLARLQILPQAEIGALVNLAVLAQAMVIAGLVLLVPLAAPGMRGPREAAGRAWAVVYFPALALGFLFLEIFAIEKASLVLDDRAAGFAVVLSAMLMGSGLGSFLSAQFLRRPALGVWLACLAVGIWAAAMFLLLPAAVRDGGLSPYGVRVAAVAAAMAPVSVAMGLPFPLGLQRLAGSAFLPWAWALNGAFSVVATPLANLAARNIGFSAVLAGAVLMYVLAATSFRCNGDNRFGSHQ